jgi:hypothetical protein
MKKTPFLMIPSFQPIKYPGNASHESAYQRIYTIEPHHPTPLVSQNKHKADRIDRP